MAPVYLDDNTDGNIVVLRLKNAQWRIHIPISGDAGNSLILMLYVAFKWLWTLYKKKAKRVGSRTST